jgi:hypothetical protein
MTVIRRIFFISFLMIASSCATTLKSGAAMESASVADPPTLAVPPIRRPPDPYCPDQPDISDLQAEFDAYNKATYARALAAQGMVPTTMKLKWNALTYDPDAKERTPWKVTTVNGERVLPGEVIQSDCGPSAPTVHFGTKGITRYF